MICILGCLDTEEGLKICQEMSTWLKNEYDLFIVHQKIEGNKFEYPAISKAIDCAIRFNEPVLYLHTKGAANKIPLNYKSVMMNPKVNFPKNAIPADCQRVVRMMWKKEFSGENLNKYLKILNTNEPTVACPLTGIEKITWQNGFILNSNAAKELLKTFHFTTNRWYYEQMFRNTIINVKGLLSNEINIGNDELKMWDIIWSFYE